ncbi:sugar porter family MFS transporter [Saccharopolyspora sp. HNM0986]|uniref:sugar porter family MFS transporter n=1 Tax=Saccharopolyspora galaxeae TaxID=2781241 RepID=UPI00190B8589|nr:sugar porter family MFS transporter [Saccharopolyspora sp. HNM0986]MBK0868998.1 sugar porter family MFS transporter [Saccharopolyspora sp. HNM0986]
MNDNAVVENRRRSRGAGATVIAAFGGLLFGYDTGIISAALLYLGPEFGLGDQSKEVVVASLLVGAIIGVAAGGAIMDRVGRRRTLLGVAVLFLVGAVASGTAGALAVLLVARVLLGLAIGAASVAVPAYIAEIAPAEQRGRLVSVNQLMISSGILISYVTGYALADAQAWRWMLAVAAVPALVMLIALPMLPESPRWLVAQGREDEARAVLSRGRARGAVDAEIAEITAAMRAESRYSFRDLLGSRFRPGIVLGVGVAATNQLVGVNAVTYYTPTLLTDSGFGASAAILSSVGLGIANVVFTFAGLMLVDRIGRRPLVLGGTGLVVLSLVVIGAVYAFTDLQGGWAAVLLAFLMIYQASFSASLGLAMWLVNSEVFPTEVRGKAGSAGLATHWILNLLISVTVLTTINAITPSGLFWLYAVLGGLGLLFLHRRLPETRGRTLEQVDAQLNGRQPVAG